MQYLYNNFQTIPKNRIILFEFKNCKDGEKKMFKQVIDFQRNANFLFKNEEDFFHIIIIKTIDLGNSLKNYISDPKNKSQIDSLRNIAVLGLNDINEICSKQFDNMSQMNSSQSNTFQIQSENASRKKSNIGS